MAHGPVPRLGPLLGILYLVGATSFLVSAFVYAASDPAPPRLEALHTTAGVVLVMSWMTLVTAAILTLLRGRRAGDLD